MFATHINKKISAAVASTALLMSPLAASGSGVTTRIPDTGVTKYYNNNSKISAPRKGKAFYGQDAQYQINKPSYVDNRDGTVTDRITGLMWAKSMGSKMTLQQAQRLANQSNLGGHSDWRIPTITELYSLIQYTGKSGRNSKKVFLDTRYFKQPFGDRSKGERPIDAQTWSSTIYTGKAMNQSGAIFGVNFIDGRIKAYPKMDPRTRQPKKMYFRLVRGNKNYGKNSFANNGNGTISDRSTGLMWARDDSKQGMNWKSALAYCEGLQLAGQSDWRLPNAKELQSIVDYSRSPSRTRSAAISKLFNISTVSDPAGRMNYPQTWTSTTHLDGRDPEAGAVYICFGKCQGKMRGQLMDVHGAGAQRSDPKSGNAGSYPQYHGPQGDVRYVYNHARCVRGASQ